jgi:hypothetical protein
MLPMRVRVCAVAPALLVLGSLGVVTPTASPSAGAAPISRQIQLSLTSQPLIAVTPRVSSSGSLVTASGDCAGSPHLRVIGRAAGWFDIPPVYVDEFPVPDAAGHWSSMFPMPAIPSTVSLFCTQGSTLDSASTLISPIDGLSSLSVERDGSGVIVTIPNVITPEQLVAFTSSGASVPIAILDTTVRVRLQPPGVPVRVIIIGIESLGENAEARQTSRVQAWSLDVGIIDAAIPISGLAPAQRIPSATTA